MKELTSEGVVGAIRSQLVMGVQDRIVVVLKGKGMEGM